MLDVLLFLWILVCQNDCESSKCLRESAEIFATLEFGTLPEQMEINTIFVSIRTALNIQKLPGIYTCNVLAY